MKVFSIFALVLVSASTSFALGTQPTTEYIDVPADEAAMALMPADRSQMRSASSTKCGAIVSKAADEWMFRQRNSKARFETTEESREFVRSKCGDRRRFHSELRNELNARPAPFEGLERLHGAPQKPKVQRPKRLMEAVLEAAQSPIATIEKLIRPVTTYMNPSSTTSTTSRTSSSN